MLGVLKEEYMGIAKDHRYEVRVRSTGGPEVALESSGKPSLQVATPPDFRGGVRGLWSPEELLVGSLATCFELTLAAIAERLAVPLHDVEVDATGHLERRDGRYRFVAIELDARIVTEPGHEREMEDIAVLTRGRCIVEEALRAPVQLRVEVDVERAVVPAA
jgi:organic hydroperoxide reductase OsmC/OhrA